MKLLGKTNELIGFGIFLNRVRSKQRMSIERLSERSRVSISQITRIETNVGFTPKPSTLLKLSQGLCMPYERLMQEAGYTKMPRQDYEELGKANEIKCKVVNEMLLDNGMVERFEITLNNAIESLENSQIIDIEYKQNHFLKDYGCHTYYETALIIYKEITP